MSAPWPEACSELVYTIQVRTGKGEWLCDRASFTKCERVKDGLCPLAEKHPEAFCPPAESDWGVTCRRTTYHTLHTPVPLTGRSDDPL
jgi:hypothetical protein